MIYDTGEMEREAALEVAKFMAGAARTAPKGRGVDNLEILIIDGKEKDRLAEAMREISKETGEDFYGRDANNLDNSHCIVMLGVQNIPAGTNNCGHCGFGTCAGAIKAGANCAFKVADLGIACGSAVAVAADHRVDSRIMFSAGKGADRLGLFSDKVRVSYGIPVAIRGKSPFFDRG